MKYNSKMSQTTYIVVASYSELYEEGEVEHINGPSLSPSTMNAMNELNGRLEEELIQRPKRLEHKDFYSSHNENISLHNWLCNLLLNLAI